MKVMIFADYPGTCGVRSFPDGSGSQIIEIKRSAKIQQLNEINSCIDGLHDAGVDEILVWDNDPGDPDSSPLNVYSLRPGVYLAESRDYAGPVARVDASFDAAIHLGAWSMNHTPGGYMAHTLDDKMFDSVKINGQFIGDIGINILRNSYFNVPTVLVSGDDKACAEAAAFNGLPLETVAAKKGLSRHRSMNYSATDVCAELREKSCKAIRNLSGFKAKKLSPEGGYTAEIRLLSQNFLTIWTRMGYQPKDDNTVEIRSDDLLDLVAQLKSWHPGAHFKRYGLIPDAADFFTPAGLEDDL